MAMLGQYLNKYWIAIQVPIRLNGYNFGDAVTLHLVKRHRVKTASAVVCIVRSLLRKGSIL